MDRWYTIREYSYASIGGGERIKQVGVEQNMRKFHTIAGVRSELKRQLQQIEEAGSAIRLEVIEHRAIKAFDL